MTRSVRALVALLADGQLHSGEELATALGVTRAAIWKQVGELRGRGFAIESLDRRGYRLHSPIELLDASIIRRAAESGGRALPADMEVLFEVDSTNDYLYGRPASRAGCPKVVFAELQYAGRGRRGRDWRAPPGSGLTLSIGWSFEEMPADLPALPLAMGVCVIRVLRQAGAMQAMLKWPNDIVADHCKLGGLLVQLRSEVGGPAYAVVGLGLNLSLPADLAEAVHSDGGIPATDLRALMGRVPARNELGANLAAAMIDGLELFGREGFPAFVEDWRRFDSLLDSPVRLVHGDSCLEGMARGADADGALRLECKGRIERFFSGDVSVRMRVP